MKGKGEMRLDKARKERIFLDLQGGEESSSMQTVVWCKCSLLNAWHPYEAALS